MSLLYLQRAFLWQRLEDRPKEACLEQQGESFAPPSGLWLGGLSDLAEAEEVKLQALGPSC